MTGLPESPSNKHAALLAMAGLHVPSAATVNALWAAGLATRAHQQGNNSQAAFFQAQQQLVAAAAAGNTDFFSFSGAASNSENTFLKAALAQERAEKQMIVNQLAAMNQASALNAQVSALTSAAGIRPDFAAQLHAMSQNSLATNSLLFRRAAANQEAVQQAQQFRALAAAGHRATDLFPGGGNATLLLQQASHAQQLYAASQHQGLKDLAANSKYRDASLMPDPVVVAPESVASEKHGGRRGGAADPFPQKLHRMLTDLEKTPGGAEVASFLPHGRAFSINNPKRFVTEIMPGYFRMSRFSSFQRQLNLYDFKRITEGRDKGSYYHEFFLLGRPALCSQMKRTKIKGQNSNWVGQGGYRDEVNFYNMPPVQASKADMNMTK